MTNAQLTWLGKLLLNLLGLAVAIWVVYRAGLAILKLFLYRSLATNPLYGFLVHDLIIIIIGLVAIWCCFRLVENLYKLAINPPRNA